MNFKRNMYSLAFRKRKSEKDFFWLDEDYFFEEYSIENLGNRYWLADPFLFERDGKIYVFYEIFDLLLKRGKIGYSILNPETKTLTKPRIVLDRKYHFSFPYVFAHGENIFMMPETKKDGRVRLFRAVNFPDVWTEDAIIINDIKAVDNVFLQDGEKKFLLSSVQYFQNTPTGSSPACWVKNTLFRFLPEDDFKISPDGKIISEGDYGIRNAGKIFAAQDMLIRPGQDCRNDEYGRGMVFFKVKSVEPYSEEKLFALDYDDISAHLKQKTFEKLNGVHTYNFSENFEVIDFSGMKNFPLRLIFLRGILAVIKILKRLI